MSHDEKTQSSNDRPHGHRDRGVAGEQLTKKGSRKVTSGSGHDPEAERYEADKTFTPDRDGSQS